MDVELEEVEEGVGDGGYGAVYFGFDAVVELEGFVGFFADGEGGPLDFVVCVFDMLTRFSILGVSLPVATKA